MTAPHFVISQDDQEQPWQVRVVNSAGEIVLSGENLASESDAHVVVLAVARMFGAADPVIVRSSAFPGDGNVLGGRRAAVVRWVDTRAGSEPTC